MKKAFFAVLFFFLASHLAADDNYVFGENKDISGEWVTILSFPYSIIDALVVGIYSDYISQHGSQAYKSRFEGYLSEEPVIAKLYIGANSSGFFTLLSNPQAQVRMIYGNPGRGNGSLRLMPAVGGILWIDWVHVAEDTLLVRVFTDEYATNNGYYAVMQKAKPGS